MLPNLPPNQGVGISLSGGHVDCFCMKHVGGLRGRYFLGMLFASFPAPEVKTFVAGAVGPVLGQGHAPEQSQ